MTHADSLLARLGCFNVDHKLGIVLLHHNHKIIFSRESIIGSQSMFIRLSSIVTLVLVTLNGPQIEVESFATYFTSSKQGNSISRSVSMRMSSNSLSGETIENENKPLLVCTTAPSLEGTAFCRQVLKRGKFRVRALTRNVDSPRSQALKKMGAELFVADNEDVESLRRAFEGAHGVYGITTWSGATFAKDGSVVRDTSLDSRELEDAEVRQGQNIIDAALGTGRAYDDEHRQHPKVKHFVLQSMHRGGRRSASEYPDPDVEAPLHHKAKWRQEDALLTRMNGAESRIKHKTRWSVLRQPTYLENFDNESDAAKNTKLRSLRPGVVGGLLAEDIPLTVIAVEDLGALASRMFEEEHAIKYGNGGILVAGSERVTGKELARMANKVCNDKTLMFDYRPIPWFVLNFFIPVDYPRQLKRWLTFGGNDEGFRLPKSRYNHAFHDNAKVEGYEDFLQECRQIYPDILSVEEWFENRGVHQMTRPRNIFEQFMGAVEERATRLGALLQS